MLHSRALHDYMYMPHYMSMPNCMLNCMPHDMLLCYGYTAHYARSEIT